MIIAWPGKVCPYSISDPIWLGILGDPPETIEQPRHAGEASALQEQVPTSPGTGEDSALQEQVPTSRLNPEIPRSTDNGHLDRR